jgi:hypothetical protein
MRGIDLAVIKLPQGQAKLHVAAAAPRRSADHRSFGKRIIRLLTGVDDRALLCLDHRLRQLAKDNKCYALTFTGLHLMTSTCVTFRQAVQLATGP